jgi:chromosome segregation ATPase
LADCQETIASLQSTLAVSESALKQETTKSEIHKTSSEARERDLILQVEELTRKWAGVSQQIGDWQRKLEDYHQVCEKTVKFQQQIESLASEKNRLETEAEELQFRLKELEKEHQETINQSLQTMPVVHDKELLKIPEKNEELSVGTQREIRRLSGLYNQLKEQFAEKSSVLDAARKELFCVQEELHALQREELENCIYGDDLVSKEMVRLLAAADEERSCLEENYRHEIEQLYELVGAFVSGKQTAGV